MIHWWMSSTIAMRVKLLQKDSLTTPYWFELLLMVSSIEFCQSINLILKILFGKSLLQVHWSSITFMVYPHQINETQYFTCISLNSYNRSSKNKNSQQLMYWNYQKNLEQMQVDSNSCFLDCWDLSISTLQNKDQTFSSQSNTKLSMKFAIHFISTSYLELE